MGRTATLRFSEEQLEQHLSGSRVQVPERDILRGSLDLLQRHPLVAFARRSNVGSGFLLYRDTFERMVRDGHLRADEARYVQYGVKGAADITAMLRGGRRLEVETKSQTGRISDDQRAFGEAVNGGGGLYILARSVDDVMRGLGGA